VIGEEEMEKNIITIKDLHKRESKQIKPEEIHDIIKKYKNIKIER
jgi:histidyl-tRNA synthetase